MASGGPGGSDILDHLPTNDPLDADVPEAVFSVEICYKDHHKGSVDLGCCCHEWFKWFFLFNNPTKLDTLLIKLKSFGFKLAKQHYPPCIAVQDLKHARSDSYMSGILKSMFIDLSSDLESKQIYVDERHIEKVVEQLQSKVECFENDSVVVHRKTQCVWIIGFAKQVQNLGKIYQKLEQNNFHQTSNISRGSTKMSAQSQYVSKRVEQLDSNNRDSKDNTHPPVSKGSMRNVQTGQVLDIKQTVTTVKLKPLQQELFEGLCIEDWLRELFPECRCQYSQSEIILSGPEERIPSIHDNILHLLSTIEENSKDISLPEIFVTMLRNEGVFLEQKKYMEKQKIGCFIKIMPDGCIKIYTKRSEEIDEAIEALKAFFIDDVIHLQICCLDSSLLTQKERLLKDKFKANIAIYSNRVAGDCVDYHVVATIDIADKVRKELKGLDNELMRKKKEHISAEPSHVTFLENNSKDTLDDLAVKYSVKIDYNRLHPGLDIEGPAEYVQQVVKILKGSVLKKITSKDMHIASQVAVEYIQAEEGVQFLKEVGTQHKCTVEQEIVSVSADGASKLMFQLGIIVQSTVKFDNGSEIKLVFDDYKGIYPIEVMVRLFLQKDMGSVLKHENRGISIRASKQYRESHADVPIPDYEGGTKQDKDNLRKQFEHLFSMVPEKNIGLSLKDVETSKWKIVSFVKQIIYGFQQYMKIHNRKMKLVLFESREEEFKSVLTALKESLPDKEKSSRAIITKCSESKPIPPKRGRKMPGKTTSLHVSVKTGHLAHQQTDVIVNTTSPDLNLHGGAVSSSIVKTAGQAIQNECKTKYPNGIQFCEVAITKGYKLNCKYVYHGCLPSWTSSKLDPLQMRYILKTFVTECLYLANERNFKSISFPAMGTGNLGFPKDTVAKDMFDTVYDFESNLKRRNLESVEFVIYDKDIPTVQAFEKEEQSRATPPTIARTVQADSAKEIQIQYGRLTVSLSLGDVTEHQTMGLVVIWEDGEIFKDIPARMKYLTNAGKGWEGKRGQLFNSGVAVTDADRIYTKIIHLKADKSKIKLMIASALKQAETHYLATVAVPIQRADPLASSLDKYANAWLKAIQEFEKNRKSKCLRFIRLVFDRQDTMAIFRSILDDRKATKQQHQDPQSADDHSETRTVRITVTGNNASNFDDTFSDIENKIKDLHEQEHMPELAEEAEEPELTAEGNKSRNKDKNVPNRMQGNQKISKEQNEDFRTKKLPELQMTDDVECCVIVSMIKGMEKVALDKFLKLFNVQFSVLYPYQDDNHALIVCQDAEGAKTFIDLKKAGDVTFTKMEPQVLFNITAEVDGSYLRGFSISKQQEIKDHISKACGVKITDSNDGWAISGIIPQIEMAIHILSLADSDSYTDEQIQLQQNQMKDEKVPDKNAIGNVETSDNSKPTSREDGQFLVSKTGRGNENKTSASASNNDHKRLDHTRSQKTGRENEDETSELASASNNDHKRLDYTDHDDIHDGVFETACGIVIKVYQCGILNTKVDCIVNPTNPQLNHDGGIAKAIAKKAGNQFKTECKDFVKTNGQLILGQACHTKGGKLKYSYVIHTVGPSKNDYNAKSESGLYNWSQDLQLAVISAILEAEKLKMKSVAIPPIGADICGVIPIDTYLQPYPIAVFDVCKTITCKSSVGEIHFVADDRYMVNKMKKAFSEFFSQNANQANQAEHIQNVVPTIPNDNDDPYYPRFCQEKETMKYEAQFNKYFKVKIYTGDILNASVQALSCGQDENLLGHGYIARNIHQKSGQDYQGPFSKLKNGGPYHLGQVLSLVPARPILSGIHTVFQAITASWTEDMEVTSEKYLHGICKCFTGVLREAITLKIKSVALPLFGTGNKGADFKRPSSLLLDSILKILQENKWPECSIREIHIVNHNPEVTLMLKDKFQEHIEGEKRRLRAEKKQLNNTSNGRSDSEPKTGKVKHMESQV